MPKKKRKGSRAARRRRERRRRLIIGICLIAAIAVGAGLYFSGLLIPSDKTADPVIIAVSTEPTAEPVDETPAPTAQPTAEPTSVPTPTPVPEPTATPYAGPTPEPTRAPAYITITATGDVMLGSGGTKNAKKFPQYYEQNGPEYFFENVRDYLAEDDLTIVNLECPLTDSTSKRPARTFNFKGKPEYVQILTYGSVEICNIANNHLLDYKEAGAQDTISVLTEAGIGVSGGIDNKEVEYYTEINGYTVGSIGFTEWNFDKNYILSTTAAAAEKCDLLIVSMHWNEEGHKTMSNYCVSMGEALIDAGADIVIGNHTHSLGEIRRYKGKYIINSLGNFCFGGNDKLWNYETDVFRQRFLLVDNGTECVVLDAGIDLKPALNYTTGERRANNFKPGWPDEALGLEILKTVGGYSTKLNTAEIRWLPNSYIAEHGLTSQFGGTVVQDISAQEAFEQGTFNNSETNSEVDS